MFYGCLGAGEVPFLRPCMILFRKTKMGLSAFVNFRFFGQKFNNLYSLSFLWKKKKKKIVFREQGLGNQNMFVFV